MSIKRITKKEQLRLDSEARYAEYCRRVDEEQKQRFMETFRDTTLWPIADLQKALDAAYHHITQRYCDNDLARNIQPRIDALTLVLQERK